MRPLLLGSMLVVAVTCVLTSRDACAQGRAHARLTYQPDADVERCPTETELRDAVASRLGPRA